VIRVLSCGAGVQSSALLLMSCMGKLPKLDYAVFADTGWEPAAVYKHLAWIKEHSEAHGIPFHIVGTRNIRDDNISASLGSARLRGERWTAMPLFTKSQDGTVGQVKRQCTSEYKIAPIERWLRRTVLGLAARQRAPKKPVVEHWLGISADEIRRCRMSPHKWAINCYPLIEDFEPPMRRADCVRWYAENGFPSPPRSACIGCPYKSDAEWRRLRDEAEWASAVEFDKAIRNSGGMNRPCYLHRSCVPLDEVDLSTAEERGQGNLFESECSGLCGT